jgi:mono/diheme cytochrome c family protein
MAPDKEARLANPVNPSLESIARGKEIFVDKCMKCHGPSGRGDGPLSDTLFPRPADLIDYKTRKQPDGALFYKISKGKGAMPAWELLLSGEDRWHLINYIHSLKQKEEKSENTDTAR